jgi:hypothetical protein
MVRDLGTPGRPGAREPRWEDVASAREARA